jgi:branched-chain amino acid transport system substrate-binding protein
VLAILGPTLSDTAYAADPIAQQVGVPVLGISNAAGGITEIGSFIFRNCLGENQLTPQTVRMVKSRLKLRSAALLYADTASNRSGSSGFKKALQDSGITITTEQTFNRGDTVFTDQLLQIGDSRPDALFVSAAGTQASAILVQARGLEMDALPIVGGNAFNSSAVLNNAGSAAEGLVLGSAWTAASPTPRNQEFIRSYRDRFGHEPDQFAAQAYTGVYILAAAIKDADTTSDRRALRNALERVKGLETPLGRFAFKPNREADLPAVVQVFRNGKLELLGK